jgi:glycosyltransferase involved in cell wall biosynthesis
MTSKESSSIHILNIGPGKDSRGGISSVISSYINRKSRLQYGMSWLETQNDKNYIAKVLSFIKSVIIGPFHIRKSHIVHVHTASNVSFYRKSVFIILAKLLSRKSVLHIHGGGFSQFLEYSNKSPLRKWFVAGVLEMPSKIICLSKANADSVEYYITKEKIVIVPNPCPEAIYYNQNRRSRDVFTILYAGWIEAEKGVFDLINAFAKVQLNVTNCRLIIAGKGKIDIGKDLASSLKLNDKVIFTGWLKKNEVYKALANADIFCLPSYCEGFPMSLLEAMAYGLPVITTPVGGIPDIINPGVSGLLFQPGNIEQLAKNIQNLLDDASLRSRIGNNAKIYVESKCSIQFVEKKLDLLYSNLMK